MRHKVYGLSKSKYVEYCRCPHSLWLSTHRRELRREPTKEEIAIFEQGDRVGRLAHDLFPGAVLIDYDASNFPEMARKTAELIDAGVETICEATFIEQNTVVLVDILHKDSRGWGVYEVKSSGSVSESYLDDISIQWFVVSKHLSNLQSASLVLINKDYKREALLDVRGLLRMEDVTDEILSRQSKVDANLTEIQKRLNEQDEGEPPIGEHCGWSGSSQCVYADHCFSDVKNLEFFGLYRQNKSVYALLTKDESQAKGFADNIGDHLRLNALNRTQLDSWSSGEVKIVKDKVADFLSSLVYPVSYLDFEWLSEAVPRYNGTSPFQKIPFQFSIHIQDEAGGDLKQFGFLAGGDVDPRKEFVDQLLEYTPPSGSIIAFNASQAEALVLGQLAEEFPVTAKELLSIRDRIIDPLVQVFRKGYLYAPSFEGSFSMKSIQPFFAQGATYDDIEIKGGTQAVNDYLSTLDNNPDVDVSKVRDDLITYCGLDTKGMADVIDGMCRMLEK